MCNVNTVCFDCSRASCPTVKQIFSLIRQSLLQVAPSLRTCPGRVPPPHVSVCVCVCGTGESAQIHMERSSTNCQTVLFFFNKHLLFHTDKSPNTSVLFFFFLYAPPVCKPITPRWNGECSSCCSHCWRRHYFSVP